MFPQSCHAPFLERPFRTGSHHDNLEPPTETLEHPRIPREAVTLMTEFLRVLLRPKKDTERRYIGESRFVSIRSIGGIDGLGLQTTPCGSPARLRANGQMVLANLDFVARLKTTARRYESHRSAASSFVMATGGKVSDAPATCSAHVAGAPGRSSGRSATGSSAPSCWKRGSPFKNIIAAIAALNRTNMSELLWPASRADAFVLHRDWMVGDTKGSRKIYA
jgi:hypothetical protein